MTNKLQGIIAAVPTPLIADTKEIDIPILRSKSKDWLKLEFMVL